ncbi:MAG: hypothetical protein RBU30_20080 [Polyangia bacterium]|jgi:hypothetical protein|nr:hypothetical protein [Polyangia bacterium]
MNQDSPAAPVRRPRRWLALGALFSLALLALFGWLNLSPRPHAGFEDLRNPMAEAWSPDPRVERGWPLTAHRRFNEPSEVNASGRWDGLGLALDLGLLLAGLGLVWLIAVLGYIRQVGT